MNLPIFSEDREEITSDNNFNALSKKAIFRKKLKNSNRNAAFAEIIKSCGDLPERDEFVLIKTNGTSDTGSIFTYISEKFELDTLYLSTWVISRDNIERIIKLIDSGNLKKVVFVVSKRLKELKKSNYAYLVEEFTKRQEKCFFKVCNSHAKTFSVSTICGEKFTVTGSGNWTENPRIENYVIFNDENAFSHNKIWMEEIVYG